MADWQPLAQARPRAVAPPAPVIPPPPAAITPSPAATTPSVDPGAQPRFGSPSQGFPTPTAPAPGAGAPGGAGGYGAPGYGAGAAGWTQGSQGGAESADQIYARVVAGGVSIGIGESIGRGWELVSGNFGLAVGATAIWVLCNIAGAIPCLGILITLGVTPVVQAGLYRLFLKLHRGEPAEFGDAFSAFSTSYLQVFLYALVQLILLAVAAVPGYALMFFGNLMAHRSDGASLLLSLVGVLLILPPTIYLAMSWAFAPLIIVDKGLDFWPAMELSRKVVAKNFFGTFALFFVCGLIFLAGVMALCLGIFVAAPLALAAIAVAYDEVFGSRA